MIQRIQSVYLLLSIVCLTMVTFGTKIVSYLSDTSRYDVYAYGIDRHNIQTGFLEEELNYFPGYFVGIGLLVLGLVTLVFYKDLNRQMRFGRMYFYAYLAVLVSTLILIYIGGDHMTTPTTGRELGLGFLLLVIGFPFTFLANTGIKRDKKLLDSLDRLR